MQARAPRATFRRADRVRDRNAVEAVRRRGRRVATPSLIVQWLEREAGEQRTRLAVIAARRVLRRAVDRNRFRRIAREVFRRHRDRFPSACDVVLAARPGAERLNARALLAELDAVAHVLRAPTRPRGRT
ncbi:MAG: ribonuclease P protein component [Myxococcota bacterium]|nr:ribonuclease P protein component [Myxococcota bacterium]MDW8361011.1 ribonuclease P protein component [Myxococcales bacterium]